MTNRPSYHRLRTALVTALLVALAGCSSVPAPTIQRTSLEDAMQQTRPLGEGEGLAGAEGTAGTPEPDVRPGTGALLNRSAAARRAPDPGEAGEATFNFEGDSLHAVIKVILGDLLEQNYVIAPGVQGTVTVSTPRPVNPRQALSLLEQVLAWNNARMVWADGRYNIVPADQAVAGNVAPSTGSAESARGYEVRVIPLQFISAAEMEKLLMPYARPDAVLSVDVARNMITLGGSRSELANYMRTIEIFDVDWLEGMSVGVFPLQSTGAEDMAAQLESVFGRESETPVAGMYRFMPLTGINSIMVITHQPKYLRDIEQWISRIDLGGQTAGIYVYEVRHSKAVDLAEQLSAAFGAANRSVTTQSDRLSLAPGLETSERRGRAGGGADGQFQQQGGARRVGGGGGGFGDGDGVTITAIEENNALIVRATPSEWESIRRAIERLDVMPLQVHIEAQIVEVKLSGSLQYGVSWFFRNAIEDPTLASEARSMTGTQPIAGTLGGEGLSWSLLRRNSLAVIQALDQVSDVRVLSAPSLLVRNNAEAQLEAGRQIPVASTIISPITGGGTDTSNTVVQFRQTGVNLRVRPRVSTNGMVFLEIVQEVSTPAVGGNAPSVGGNPSVDRRNLSTEVAVQSGETIMLAGLINDEQERSSAGLPGLSRLPVVGGLFGGQTQRSDREEIVILITPTVIRDPAEARRLTDEYGRRFRALEPLRGDDAN
ncbi:MAG: type II secretion system secretin GspD [Lysobacteraceae bacterium]